MKRSSIWPAFRPLQSDLKTHKAIRGSGVWVELEDGNTIIDAVSSWWVNLHGHAHPLMVKAIAEQAARLEHIIFAGFTHEPAETLAENLLSANEGRFEKVFYSDDGSTAVEVALKMAIQYWTNIGQARKRFLAFEGAYHGDTFGAMSVGARSLFSKAYERHLFGVDFLPYPETWLDDEQLEAKEAASLKQLEAELAKNDVAALIVEPLIQGAGGMRMARPAFFRELVKRCRNAGTLVIFDEVMTGFGRTGTLFAWQKIGIEPDLLCLSKGITGGFLPLSATLVRGNVVHAFDSPDAEKAFWHAHSYTGNPLACAAGVASLHLLAEKQFERVEEMHRKRREELDKKPWVKQLRQCGTVLAFELDNGRQSGYLNPIGNQLKDAFIENGALIRPLGNTIYLMTPYTISEQEMDRLYQVMIATIEAVISD